MESLWHPLNSESGWSSSVMRLTYQTLINNYYGEMEREKDGRGGEKER